MLATVSRQAVEVRVADAEAVNRRTTRESREARTVDVCLVRKCFSPDEQKSG